MMRQQRSTTQFRIRNTFSPLCVPNSNREINYNGGRACTQELASKWIRFNKVFSIQVSRTGSAYTHTVSAITLDSKYMVQLIFIWYFYLIDRNWQCAGNRMQFACAERTAGDSFQSNKCPIPSRTVHIRQSCHFNFTENQKPQQLINSTELITCRGCLLFNVQFIRGDFINSSLQSANNLHSTEIGSVEFIAKSKITFYCNWLFDVIFGCAGESLVISNLHCSWRQSRKRLSLSRRPPPPFPLFLRESKVATHIENHDAWMRARARFQHYF